MLQLQNKKDVLILKEKIDHHAYISFDMFDTLVKRDCWKPTALFDLIQEKINCSFHIQRNFAELRVKAEKEARKISSREEVTLDEIYSRLDLGLSAENMENVKAWEEKFEYDCCQRNPFIYPVYQYCVAHHKKILIITDIYLPIQLIKKILAKLGIQYDALYVSSEKRLTKQSGNLYQYALQEQHILASEVLHIGDNLKSDFRMAQHIGMDAVHISKNLALNQFIDKEAYRADTDYRNLCAFINNHANLHSWDALHPKEPLDYFAQAGYEAEGPVLYGFVKWLQEQFEKDHIEKVFFLARDGQIMQQAYNMFLGTLPNTYMYASRQALIVPYLWMESEIESLSSIMYLPKYTTISSFLKHIGLPVIKFLPYYKKIGLDIEMKYEWDKLVKNPDFLTVYNQYVKPPMIEKSKVQYQYLLQYLKQIGFSGKVAIVDIGWFGHMQYALQNIVKQSGISVEIHGYYLGLRGKSPVLSKIKGKGYLFDKGFHDELSDIEGEFNCIMEALFTADHGTTLGYKKEEKIIVPVLGRWEYREEALRQDYFYIHCAQKGALSFVKDASKAYLNVPIVPDVIFINWLQLGCYPSQRYAKLFGGLHILDGDIHPFAAPCPDHLCFHWPAFAIGLRDSWWRIGYLAGICGDRVPIYKIYKSLKAVARIIGLHR